MPSGCTRMKEFREMVPYTQRSILVPQTMKGRIIRDLGLLATAAVAFVGIAILCLMVTVAEAAPHRAHSDNPGGGLFVRPNKGSALTTPAPELKTDVKVKVTGVIARVTVAQSFLNPAQEWVEGVYVFPLSDKGAVDHMVMKIGDKVVEGTIRERRAAKRQYQSAKRTGRQASLVEQERPNIFTVSVANIPPKAEVSVEITYQEALPMEDGLMALRLPQVLTPRYIPGKVQVAGLNGTGVGINTTDVPDAERITPPVRDPSLPPQNPLSLEVLVDAGLPLASLKSRYHQISVKKMQPTNYQVKLRDGTVPADRDFVLEWRPEPGDAPKAALFAEEKDGATYLLAMIVPPNESISADLSKQTLPREVVFIIDTSGSMHGESIEEAAEALHFALGKLAPQDKFNIISFSDRPTSLFADPRQANEKALGTAKQFVNQLKAAGGTELSKALDAALDSSIDSGRLRQIVLLTDGAVGNEAALFRMIRRGIGDTRLFTIGIGSAPNSYFMNRAARFGRGSFTYIGKTSEVAERMTKLLAKLGEPVLTDLEVRFPAGTNPDLQPGTLPDLYRGEPIVFAAKMPKGATMTGSIEINGRLLDQKWTQQLDISTAVKGPGIAKHWAKRKIDRLMEGLQDGQNPEQVRLAVVDVAVGHQVVSPYTSLVAVAKQVARPKGESMIRKNVPANPPAGWTPPAKGQKTQQPPNNLRKAAGSAANGQLAMMSSSSPVPSAQVTVGLAARGATPAMLQALIGLFALALALGLWLLRRRLAG
ncbi:MAG: marine proteobacterial sortase target protein [Rhodospirillaceae bacterium]|nr:marine proteobacterial sortase target protein [Rhodospirillaceae bacterium]